MNLSLFLQRLAILTLLIAAIIGGVLFFTLGPHIALSLIINVPFGYLGLFFLAKDVQNIFLGLNHSIPTFRFIFRLACFAFLLYLMLVQLRLNPIAVVAGLMLPLFAMLILVFINSVTMDKNE